MSALILASTSKTRALILRNAGVDFEPMAPAIDEEALKRQLRKQSLTAREQVAALSEAKALSISKAKPGRLVLGCDQMLLREDSVFDKPFDRQDARQHLRMLSGRSHILLTGAALAEDGVVIWHTLSEPRLTMHALTEAEIETYLDRMGEAAFTSVGAYQIESLGAQLFSQIEGDWFAILGLPLLPVMNFLRQRCPGT